MVRMSPAHSTGPPKSKSGGSWDVESHAVPGAMRHGAEGIGRAGGRHAEGIASD